MGIMVDRPTMLEQSRSRRDIELCHKGSCFYAGSLVGPWRVTTVHNSRGAFDEGNGTAMKLFTGMLS